MEESKVDSPRNPPPLVILLKEPAQKQPLKIIDSPSKNTKMAHKRRLGEETSAEHSRGNSEAHCYRRMVDASGREIFVSKLPSGEYLVEQSPKNIKKPQQLSTTDALNSLRLKIEQKMSAKRATQPEKVKQLKVRRNPSRLSRKKSDEDYPRPRLLASKRRGTDSSSSLDTKKLKLSDVPYMNTRSITKRLYNVGAVLQTPTIHDELEFREWPVHGMHDRPVYHPQVGVATEFINRCFTSLDGQSYHEIPWSSEAARSTEEFGIKRRREGVYENSHTGQMSFEKSMQLSLNAVLAYAAQVLSPEYRQLTKSFSHSTSGSSEAVQNTPSEVDKKQEKSHESSELKTEKEINSIENEKVPGNSCEDSDIEKTVRNLLTNTTLLFCLSSAVHQDSMAQYLDKLGRSDCERLIGMIN